MPDTSPTIVLVRHGKPTMRVASRPWQWINSHEVNRRMDAYDQASLDPHWNGPRAPRIEGHHSISSDLVRAIETAKLIVGEDPREISPLFREVPLPRFRRNLRLPSMALVTMSRLGWFWGFMEGEESRIQTNARVREAADHLEDRVQSHRKVALFSHGFFLWLLSRELGERGWTSEKKGPFSYLETAEFLRL